MEPEALSWVTLPSIISPWALDEECFTCYVELLEHLVWIHTDDDKNNNFKTFLVFVALIFNIQQAR